MDFANVKIENLRDKDNWHIWSFIIRTLLEDNDDVLAVCEGKLTKPAEDSENYETKLKRFTNADKTTRRIIVHSLERRPMELIVSCTTARDMWMKLNSVYDMKSEENLSAVQKQFYDFKWTESESVDYNISKLEVLSSKMKSLGSELSEGMFMNRILSLLPQKFNHFHSAWDSVEDSKRTVDNLTTRLMSEEMRFAGQEVSYEKSTALVADKNKPKTFYPRQNNTNLENKKQGSTCFNCGKPGHVKKECFRCYICKKGGHKSDKCYRRKEGYNGNRPTSNQEDDSSKRGTGLIASQAMTKGGVWIIDSGASDHMSKRRDWFSTFEEFAEPLKIAVGDGKTITACGRGNINIITYANDKEMSTIMHDVLFVPGIVYNLFSVTCAGKRGVDCLITNNGTQCILKRENEIVATGSEFGNLLKLNINVVISKSCNLSEQIKSNETCSLQLWHERLCHQNVRHVRCYLNNSKIKFSDDNNFFCEGCAYGKQHRLTFHKRVERATKPREIIFTDVCGPMEIESIGKKMYFVIFKDDFSSYREIYFIRHKSEVIEKLKLFCQKVENQFNESIKEIHSDGGREYINKSVESFLHEKGIKHTVNVPYTPEQNGIAERENRIILEAARSMVHSNANLPLFLWAESMNTAVHVINRTGPSKCENKTPYELWYNKEPNVDKLKVFETECFVHVPEEKRKKLDKKSVKGFVVGYHENCKGYRVYVPSMRDVILSRDILFKPEKLSAEMIDLTRLEIKNKKESENVSEKDNFDSLTNDANEIINNFQVPLQSSSDNNQENRQLRDRRQIKRTEFYGCPVTFLTQQLPSNYNEAIMSDEKENWQTAMQSEMNSLYENETWILVEKPENKKVINCRWVFTKKLSSDSSEIFKARVVIKGYSQKEGIDYKETFSPVVRFDTVRFLLSVAANENLVLGQFDVKTAFLYGNLKEEIYMKQPEGFDDGTSRVCKLLKSLYGLKQAPRCWTEHFTNFLENLGFVRSNADSCFYIYVKDGQQILLTIYVDDGLIAASNESLINKLFKNLSEQFTITSTKNVKHFLGMEISRLQDGSIFVNQSSYTEKILRKFKMIDANNVSTPIDCNNNNVTEEIDCNEPFREAVGNLMFLQIVTRPDISFSVNVVSRELENPKQSHWQTVKRIFRYLKGTIDVGLLYSKNDNFEVYSDADFAGDLKTRKSTSGVVSMFANAAITWQSKKQQCVALSTTEAEYVSAALATKEIIWLKKLFDECSIVIPKYTLFVDNMSAIKLVKNPEFHQRSKHIDVKYHFIRDSFQKGEIDVQFVKSEDQIADIFTKALPKPRFVYLREHLGLRSKSDLIDYIVKSS